jgi:4-hydroxy 2-oxovalerate aldolase
LRDGGYVNDWNFGIKPINGIIRALKHSRVDIIEYGFLTKNILFNENLSKFNSFGILNSMIKDDLNSSMNVCMINYGEFPIEEVPKSIDSKSIGAGEKRN